MKGEKYLMPSEPLIVPKYIIYYVTHIERNLSFLYLMPLFFTGGGGKKEDRKKNPIIFPFFNNKIITSHGGAHLLIVNQDTWKAP